MISRRDTCHAGNSPARTPSAAPPASPRIPFRLTLGPVLHRGSVAGRTVVSEVVPSAEKALAGIRDGRDTEYMWLNELTFADDRLSGRINNQPRIVGTVEYGQTYAFSNFTPHEHTLNLLSAFAQRRVLHRLEAVGRFAGAGRHDGVQVLVGELRAGDERRHLLLFLDLPVDEVADVGVVHVEADHLGGSSRRSA